MESYSNVQMRDIIKDYPVSTVSGIIDEYIHSARDREIAKRTILENEHYEPLSAEFELTPRHVCNIVKKARKVIITHLCT